MKFFQDLMRKVDTSIDKVYTIGLDNVIEHVANLIPILATLVFIFIGISLLMGWLNTPVKPLLMASITYVLIALVATASAEYNAYIGDTLRDLPDDLAGLLLPDTPMAILARASGSTIGFMLDELGVQTLEGINVTWKNSSGPSQKIGAAFICAILFIVWVLMSVAATQAILMAKIGITVMVMLGPIFICTLFFSQTRDYFSKWVAYCVQFSIVGMLIGSFLAIAHNFTFEYFIDFSNGLDGIDYMAIAAPTIVLAALFSIFGQIPSMASSVSGGIGLAMGNMAAKAAGAGGKILGKAAGSIGNVASNLANKAANTNAMQKNSLTRGLGNTLKGAGNLASPQARQAKKQLSQTKTMLNLRASARNARKVKPG